MGYLIDFMISINRSHTVMIRWKNALNDCIILYASLLLVVELNATSESASALSAYVFSVVQCETDAVQEFVVAFSFSTTVFLFSHVAVRRI